MFTLVFTALAASEVYGFDEPMSLGMHHQLVHTSGHCTKAALFWSDHAIVGGMSTRSPHMFDASLAKAESLWMMTPGTPMTRQVFKSGLVPRLPSAKGLRMFSSSKR